MNKRIVYLNGKFVPLTQAKISVLDRGFLFGDGVYEVIPFYAGKTFKLREHFFRLRNSLRAIYCKCNFNYQQLTKIVRHLLWLNNLSDCDGLVYLQVTRGVDHDRNRALSHKLIPTVFILVKPLKPLNYQELRQGKSAITLPDIRWQYCYIKSISLLPTLLLIEKAQRAQAEEVILVRDGKISEGASSNVFVVKNRIIFTPILSHDNLSGVTRDLIFKLARKHKFKILEKNITLNFLKTADEIWISSSTRGIYPIVKLDGKQVGNGGAGVMWERMIQLYQSKIITK